MRDWASSRWWIVLASTPVASDSLFAARPVGAQSRHRTFLCPQNQQDGVDERRFLPTPGPPVMTKARVDRASLSASRWLAASSLQVFC